MGALKPERCPACGRKQRRSQPQNALMWTLLHMIAEKIEPGGKSFSAETWHNYFKSRFLGCDEMTLPNGKTLERPRSTAALDVAEFSDYMTKLEAWAAERNVWLADLEAA